MTSLGVVDFSAAQLARMAEAGLATPGIDQLEASRCRSIPAGLRKLAKEQGMRLLSHQDAGGRQRLLCALRNTPALTLLEQSLWSKPTLSTL